MGPLRDYRRVIQTAPRCCDTEPCAATRNQPALLRQAFRSIVERSWIRLRYTCSAGRPAPRCCKAPRPVTVSRTEGERQCQCY
jgi:hypothetical protein